MCHNFIIFILYESFGFDNIQIIIRELNKAYVSSTCMGHTKEFILLYRYIKISFLLVGYHIIL
jgi:hypothetical protein